MSEIKLNLGCGHDYREGWVNIDSNDWHKIDLHSDVTWLKPVDDLSADHALAQDVLEHISRTRVMTVLCEWNRVLKMGGTIEIRVPDIQALVGLMSSPQWDTLEGHERLIQCVYGTQSYVGDFHLAGFTQRTLRHQLEAAGFLIESLRHKDAWLFQCLCRKIRHTPPDPMVRIEDPRQFLITAYKTILSRDPDPQGFEFYLQQLSTGTTPESILATLHWAAKYGENCVAVSTNAT